MGERKTNLGVWVMLDCLVFGSGGCLSVCVYDVFKGAAREARDEVLSKRKKKRGAREVKRKTERDVYHSGMIFVVVVVPR